MTAAYSAFDPQADRPAVAVASLDELKEVVATLDAKIHTLQEIRGQMLAQINLSDSARIDRVFWAVTYHCGVTRDDLVSRSRVQRIADARLIFLYAAGAWTKLADIAVAAAVHRDRSMCPCARRRIPELAATDRSFRDRYNAVARELGLPLIP